MSVAPPRTSREHEVMGNKYAVERRLGEGGMGEVYRALHVGIGRPFAIKFLHAHLARSDEFVRRFQREAQSAGAPVDENIVSVTDFGVAEDGSPYLVMEYLEGESLAEVLLRCGFLPPARAVHIVIQAGRGLAHAHAAGIVHRDLKPENVPRTASRCRATAAWRTAGSRSWRRRVCGPRPRQGRRLPAATSRDAAPSRACARR